MAFGKQRQAQITITPKIIVAFAAKTNHYQHQHQHHFVSIHLAGEHLQRIPLTIAGCITDSIGAIILETMAFGPKRQA
jgi:23S rRNA maturation-related 3'-5' exoribonuclease YhaM